MAAENSYVGSKACKKCHLKEYNSWAETKMAKAFDLLKPGAVADKKKQLKLDPAKDYTADKECVGCHTTGFRKAGGFVDVATTPDLVGVGCEMCHGPGGTYTQKQYMSLENKEFKRADLVPVGLAAQPSKDSCVVCHNEKSPAAVKPYGFDFVKRVKQGTHEKFPEKFKH